MTAPQVQSSANQSARAAYGLAKAVFEGNRIDEAAAFAAHGSVDLIAGLIYVVGELQNVLRAETGATFDQIDARIGAIFMDAGTR